MIPPLGHVALIFAVDEMQMIRHQLHFIHPHIREMIGQRVQILQYDLAKFIGLEYRVGARPSYSPEPMATIQGTLGHEIAAVGVLMTRQPWVFVVFAWCGHPANYEWSTRRVDPAMATPIRLCHLQIVINNPPTVPSRLQPFLLQKTQVQSKRCRSLDQ